MREEIKAYRKSKKWSQEEMAKKLGIKQSALSHVERGNRDISKNIALALNKLNRKRFPLYKLLAGQPRL